MYYKYSLPLTNRIAVQRNPIITEIKTGDVGIVEFVERERLDGFLDAFLCHRPASQFRLIGFVENFASFAQQLSSLLDVRIDPSVAMRARSNPPVPDSTRSEIASLLPLDLDRYDEFRLESKERSSGSR